MYGTYFKNKKDSPVLCTCCGKKIIKGYIVGSRSLGENCYDTIRVATNYNVTAPSTVLGVQKMHLDWIKA